MKKIALLLMLSLSPLVIANNFNAENPFDIKIGMLKSDLDKKQIVFTKLPDLDNAYCSVYESKTTIKKETGIFDNYSYSFYGEGLLAGIAAVKDNATEGFLSELKNQLITQYGAPTKTSTFKNNTFYTWNIKKSDGSFDKTIGLYLKQLDAGTKARLSYFVIDPRVCLTQ